MAWTRRRLALYLSLMPGIGGKTVRTILLRADLLGYDPSKVLSLSPESLQEEFSLGPMAAQAIANAPEPLRDQAMALMERLESLKVQYVTAADANYPARLETMDPDPPAALYFHGNQRLLEGKTFSVLSSRNAPPADLDRIESLAEEGVLNSEILVAGHNRPEYMRAAVVPLRWGSPRILCLDRGLFSALGEELNEEPFAAARLWRYQFDKTTDLAISPVGPTTGYGKPFNRLRDRLIACLSDRLDFVNLRTGGNMASLARMALKAGRRVRVAANSDLAGEFLGAGAEALPDAS